MIKEYQKLIGLVAIALTVLGIYGYLSGLFTPHYYYEVTKYNNSSCNKGNRAIIYINKRERYLIRATAPDKKYKLESSTETLNMYIYQDLIPFNQFASLAIKQEGRPNVLTFRHKYFYEKYKGKMVPVLEIAKHNKIEGTFQFWKEGSLDLEDFSNLEIKPRIELRNKLKICEITKQTFSNIKKPL